MTSQNTAILTWGKSPLVEVEYFGGSFVGLSRCFEGFVDMSYEHFDQLEGEAKHRYQEKLDLIGVQSCPYRTAADNWINDPKRWPDVEYPNVYHYLIKHPSKSIFIHGLLFTFSLLMFYLSNLNFLISFHDFQHFIVGPCESKIVSDTEELEPVLQ